MKTTREREIYKINREKIETSFQNTDDSEPVIITPYNEIIDNFKPNALLTLETDFPKPFEKYNVVNDDFIDYDSDLVLYVKRFENSTAYLYKYQTKTSFFVQVTRNQKSSSGISTGDICRDGELFKDKYKEQPIIINGTKEDFLHFPSNNVVFFKKDNTISGWLLYNKGR